MLSHRYKQWTGTKPKVVELGAFSHGDTATSRLLDGFAVDVTALFEYAEG